MTASQHVWGAVDFAFKSIAKGRHFLRDLGKSNTSTLALVENADVIKRLTEVEMRTGV